MERIIAAAYLVKPEFIMKGTIYQTGKNAVQIVFVVPSPTYCFADVLNLQFTVYLLKEQISTIEANVFIFWDKC